jgi:hypothetical protein
VAEKTTSEMIEEFGDIGRGLAEAAAKFRGKNEHFEDMTMYDISEAITQMSIDGVFDEYYTGPRFGMPKLVSQTKE